MVSRALKVAMVYAIKMGPTEVDLIWFASLQVDIVDIYSYNKIGTPVSE